MSVIDKISNLNSHRTLTSYNDVTTSTSASTKIIKELKGIREEMKFVADEISGKNKAKVAGNSPYLADREQENIIKDTVREKSWRNVKSREQELQTAAREHNLRKINLLF